MGDSSDYLIFACFLQFSDIDIKAESEGICTYNAQWELIDNNKRWQPKTYAIFVIFLFN